MLNAIAWTLLVITLLHYADHRNPYGIAAVMFLATLLFFQK